MPKAISTNDLRCKLREHFGFQHFRRGQARVVRAALEGNDVLVVMPTGSGKSLCFQLPALELSGVTISSLWTRPIASANGDMTSGRII